MKTGDTQPIKDSLQRLMTAMTNSGLEVASHLQPGLTRQEIVVAFAEIGLTPSEDMIGFYEFSNGIIVDGTLYDDQIALFWGYYIMPLDEAADRYRRFSDFIQDLGDQQLGTEPLDASCFPFLSWDSDCYLIDFAAERMGKPCILSYAPETGAETEYSNLRSMIDALAESYEQKVFSDESGEVTSYGGPESYLIAQKHNPDVSKWNGGPSPFANFIPSHDTQDDADETVNISHLTRRFTKNPLGPQATLYMISYSNPGGGASVFEVVIIMPSTNQLPPMAYISKPPKSMNISDEQIIREAASDVREQYGFVADVGSDESLAWRNKMPQYMQMLAGI